jgi:hypothetical protein
LTVVTGSDDPISPTSSSSNNSSNGSSNVGGDRHPGLPRPISDPLNSPHSSNSNNNSNSTSLQVTASYDLWYDHTNIYLYRISLIMISLSFALFALADYIILHQLHDEGDWLTDALIIRLVIIAILLITLLLTLSTCTSHDRNRLQLCMTLCSIIVGVGPLLHYGQHIPFTNNGIWATASNHYLSATLRYLLVICSSFQLRFAYACTSVILVYLIGAIGITIIANDIPTDYIVYGIAYSLTGIWLAYQNDVRQRLLHSSLITKQVTASTSPSSPTLRPSSVGHHNSAMSVDLLPSLNSSSHQSHSTNGSIDFGCKQTSFPFPSLALSVISSCL